MLTPFGKALRKLRIDYGEVLRDMSRRLDVSPSFLSSVETGKRSVPKGWVERIVQSYNLSEVEAKQLSNLALDSVLSIKIDLKESADIQRQAALIFARDFSSLSEENANKIITLLKAKH